MQEETGTHHCWYCTVGSGYFHQLGTRMTSNCACIFLSLPQDSESQRETPSCRNPGYIHLGPPWRPASLPFKVRGGGWGPASQTGGSPAASGPAPRASLTGRRTDSVPQNTAHLFSGCVRKKVLKNSSSEISKLFCSSKFRK